MKKYQASGAIGMLLTLLVIGIVFIAVMPSLKGTGGAGGSFFMDGDSIDAKSVETHVNQQVEDIERLRKNNLKELNNINQEF